MATTKQTFAIWAPYCTDPEVLKRRSDARAAHLEGLKRLAAESFLSASHFCRWGGFHAQFYNDRAGRADVQSGIGGADREHVGLRGEEHRVLA
jgi:hypothetical protein